MGDDPGELDQAALGARRPQGRQAGPRRERGQQSDRRDLHPAQTGDGQQARRRTDENEPPDGDAHLAADDLVVAPAAEPEVDHEAQREDPGAQRAAVDPLETDTQAAHPGDSVIHRQVVRPGRGVADALSEHVLCARVRLVPLLALALAALLPGAAAARPLALGFADGVFNQTPFDNPWFDRALESEATFLELNLTWASTAPERPGGDATDPGNPAYDFSGIDETIGAAAAHGLDVSLRITKAPRWAEADGRPVDAIDGSWRPDAEAFGQFAQAVARRYDGTYQGLPRVRSFQAWGEVNLEKYLAPQWVREGGRWQPASPAIYRRLLNAFYAGVKAAQPDSTVITAGTAPFGDPPGGDRMPPAIFVRDLLCLKGFRLRLRECPDPAYFDALAHHPYSVRGPDHPALNPDNVSVADLFKLTRPVRKAVATGRALPKRKKSFWVTEFSWDSNPPDPAGVPERQLARWISEALWRFWRQGVDHMAWLLIQDQPGPDYPATYQAGLYTYDGEPKLGLRAFQFPFVVRRGRAWGRVPVSGTLIVERKSGDSWRSVWRGQVDEHEVFNRRLEFRGRPTFRARVEGVESLPYRAR